MQSPMNLTQSEQLNDIFKSPIKFQKKGVLLQFILVGSIIMSVLLAVGITVMLNTQLVGFWIGISLIVLSFVPLFLILLPMFCYFTTERILILDAQQGKASYSENIKRRNKCVSCLKDQHFEFNIQDIKDIVPVKNIYGDTNIVVMNNMPIPMCHSSTIIVNKIRFEFKNGKNYTVPFELTSDQQDQIIEYFQTYQELQNSIKHTQRFDSPIQTHTNEIYSPPNSEFQIPQISHKQNQILNVYTNLNIINDDFNSSCLQEQTSNLINQSKV